MNYFVNLEDVIKSGHENYVEFQLPGAEKEFWDKSSLYIHEQLMKTSGLEEFLNKCVYAGMAFDSDLFLYHELLSIAEEATNAGGAVAEAMDELVTWIKPHITDECNYITVIREYDRFCEKNAIKM